MDEKNLKAVFEEHYGEGGDVRTYFSPGRVNLIGEHTDYNDTQLTARVDPRTTAKAGDTIKFALDMEHAHFFDKDTELTITN